MTKESTLPASYIQPWRIQWIWPVPPHQSGNCFPKTNQHWLDPFLPRMTHESYYSEWHPDEPHNPTLWMQKTVDQIWEFYITIWHCRNGKLHGHDFEEQKCIALKATQTTVHRIYQEMTSNIEMHHVCILYHLPVEDILKWTKAHLDTYLATAEVILEQNIDPGWVYHLLVSSLAWLWCWEVYSRH